MHETAQVRNIFLHRLISLFHLLYILLWMWRWRLPKHFNLLDTLHQIVIDYILDKQKQYKHSGEAIESPNKYVEHILGADSLLHLPLLVYGLAQGVRTNGSHVCDLPST